MITNIVDKRRRKYRWRKVNAIIEATWHDNSGEDTDEIDPCPEEIEITYDEQEGVSIEEAVAWAQAESGDCPVTLFLYDDGEGTTSVEGTTIVGLEQIDPAREVD